MKEHVMKTVYVVLAVAVVTLLAAPGARAQGSPDLSGHWKGTIEIPNTPAEFELDIVRNARGELYGTATAGPEKITIPLQKISLEGRRLTFYARSDQPMQAEISGGGTIATGTATLSGYTLPLSMGRTGEAKIDPPPANRAVSKDLEGTWQAVLPAGPREYHMVLTIENRPDGTSVARHVSVDEGGLMIYVIVEQDGRKVKVESAALAVSFAGELNAGSTAISGTWTQGRTTLPLTMTRATVEGTR
jgi:hypothetical protein